MTVLQRPPSPRESTLTVLGEIGDHRARGEVVEQRAGVFKEKRRPELDARRCVAVAHAGVERAAGRVTLETAAPATPERTDRIGVERELAGGQQAQGGQGIERALGFRIEPTDRIDAVIEQIDTQRMFGAHREHIKQRAAHRELAGCTDLCDRGVTRLDEPHTERFQREGVTDREVETARGDPPAGREPL